MSSLRHIKKRIANISTIEKTTQSMKTISASKLAYANSIVSNNANYFLTSRYVAHILLSLYYDKTHAESLFFGDVALSERKALIIIGSDTGLCGSYNTNIFRKTLTELSTNKYSLVIPFAKKPSIFVNKLSTIEIFQPNISMDFKNFNFDNLKILISYILNLFMNNKLDGLAVLSSRNITSLEQEVKLYNFLPIDINDVKAYLDNLSFEYKNNLVTDKEYLSTSIYEIIFDYLFNSIYKVSLDAYVAEQTSRLNAMDQAYNNSKEMKKKIQLEYNKERQSMITTELIEIISGAEAL